MTNAPVKTRSVTVHSPDGTRLQVAKWGKVRRWNKSPDTISNLKQAIAHANTALRKRMGTIVYVGTAPVYHGKWSPASSYAGWKGNPVANYWRKKIA